jgi:hypothetical protein
MLQADCYTPERVVDRLGKGLRGAVRDALLVDGGGSDNELAQRRHPVSGRDQRAAGRNRSPNGPHGCRARIEARGRAVIRLPPLRPPSFPDKGLEA